jgi:hypothetical protein
MMNLIRTSAIAAGLLGASAVAAGASTINFGGSAPGTSIGLGSSSLETITLTAPGPITEDFFFTLSASGVLSANALEGTSSGANSLNPFSITLYNVSTSTSLATSSTPVVNGSNESVGLSSVGPLASGVDYELIVSATGAPSPQTYPISIDGNVFISQTPLPGTLPLFASGLAGFWAWSRKRKTKSPVPSIA